MRRFERMNGEDQRFVEIERSGVVLTVRSGAIGTTGQAQAKTFASEAKATAALEARVWNELADGYVEVERATTTHRAPEPEDAHVPPALPPEPAPVPKLADPIYERIHHALLRASSALDRGESVPGCDVALQRSARAAFSGDAPGLLELESQAAAYALVGEPMAIGAPASQAEFVALWAAREGPAFVLRAFARASQMSIHATGTSPAGGPVPLVAHGNVLAADTLALLEPTRSATRMWFHFTAPPWREIKAIVAQAPDRASLEAVAEEVRVGASDQARATLAIVFERSDWAQLALDAQTAPALALPLLLALTTEQATPHFGKLELSGFTLPPFAAELVAAHGAAISPYVARAAKATPIESQRNVLARAIASLASSDVATFFVDALDAADLNAIATTYLSSHPEVSFAPLARAAAKQSTARGILRGLVVAHPQLAERMRADLDPAEQRIIDAWVTAAASLVEADASELPVILRAPLWGTKRKTPTPKVVPGLSVRPFDERVAWRPGEREAALRTNDAKLAQAPSKRIELVREIQRENDGRSRGGNVRAAMFAMLPAEEAVAQFNAARHVRFFGWGSDRVAEVLVARHGVDVIPGMLALASFDLGVAVEALRRVVSPRVASVMAEALAGASKMDASTRRTQRLASDWLTAYPDAAATWLVPHAIGEVGPSRALAERALRFAAHRGHRATIEAIASRYGAAAAEAMAIVLDSDPAMLPPKKAPTLPPFFLAAAFVRPLLSGRTKALSLTHVEEIGCMLAFTDFDEPYPGLLEIREACDRASLADFAWNIFQAWLAAGAPSKQSWALHALGLFGNDDTARKLTPLVRAWPGESAHARAVAGLEILAAIGTDVALVNLHGIALKSKFAALRKKAGGMIDQIAELRGLDADELADRLVPDLDLDLDRNGRLRLDFGPRELEVAFDESLRPIILDEGRPLDDLPRPRQSDDAEKAAAATAAFRDLKKNMKAVAETQLVRFEQSMCSGRRWTADAFRTFFVEHPLLSILVRRLVWGVYERDRLVSSFRVAEDGTFASVEDELVSLSGSASVGIAHPVELGASVAAWATVFGDYQILQPFEQIARVVLTELVRLEDRVVTARVLRRLDARGWKLDAPIASDVSIAYEKTFVGSGVARLELTPGVHVGAGRGSPDQKLGEAVVLGTFGPVATSELGRDLALLV